MLPDIKFLIAENIKHVISYQPGYFMRVAGEGNNKYN